METMNVYGRKPDGSTELIGTAPITPAIKRRDIVANFFEQPNDDPDDCSDANMCLWALEQYHEWLVSEGWTAPPLKITSVTA